MKRREVLGALTASAAGLATRRDVIYGSFVGIVSFTAWFYIAAAILLFGAELVAEFEPRENG